MRRDPSGGGVILIVLGGAATLLLVIVTVYLRRKARLDPDWSYRNRYGNRLTAVQSLHRIPFAIAAAVAMILVGVFLVVIGR